MPMSRISGASWSRVNRVSSTSRLSTASDTGSSMFRRFRRLRTRAHHPPAWWPEGEPWPGRGRPPASRSQSLRRRLLTFFGFIFLLIFVAGAIINHAGGDWNGPPGDQDGPPGGFWWPPFALIIIGTLIFAVVRKVTRTLAPLEGVMDAAGRVAEGDYSVRIAAAD